jgi:hypothetical protein
MHICIVALEALFISNQASAETSLGTAGKSACATLDVDALQFSSDYPPLVGKVSDIWMLPKFRLDRPLELPHTKENLIPRKILEHVVFI